MQNKHRLLPASGIKYYILQISFSKLTGSSKHKGFIPCPVTFELLEISSTEITNNSHIHFHRFHHYTFQFYIAKFRYFVEQIYIRHLWLKNMRKSIAIRNAILPTYDTPFLHHHSHCPGHVLIIAQKYQEEKWRWEENTAEEIFRIPFNF